MPTPAATPTTLARLQFDFLFLDLREGSCGSEGCTDGCGESIACRVWVHGGREHAGPPIAMILDAILRAVYAGEVVDSEPDLEHHELLVNLGRFFADKVLAEAAQTPAEAACCRPEEHGSCCAAEDKTACCGVASGGSCGCR